MSTNTRIIKHVFPQGTVLVDAGAVDAGGGAVFPPSGPQQYSLFNPGGVASIPSSPVRVAVCKK